MALSSRRAAIVGFFNMISLKIGLTLRKCESNRVHTSHPAYEREAATSYVSEVTTMPLCGPVQSVYSGLLYRAAS